MRPLLETWLYTCHEKEKRAMKALRQLAHQEDPLARTGTPGSNKEVQPGKSALFLCCEETKLICISSDNY